MKTRPIFVRVGLFVALLAILFATFGCAGSKARDEVLLPTARAVYPRVRADIDRGIETAQETGAINPAQAAGLIADADALQAALDLGDRAAIQLIPWAPLEGMAVLGVQNRVNNGELSEANASLFYQRIVNFRDAIDRLAQRVSTAIYTRNRGRSLTVNTTSGRYRVVDGYIPPGWDTDDPVWSRYFYHNRPRAALGLPLITSGDFPFEPVDVPVRN